MGAIFLCFRWGRWRRREVRQSLSGLAGSASPSGPDPTVAPRHLPAQRGVTPVRGAFLRGQSPREEPPLTGEVAERQRWPEGLWRFAAAGGRGGVKTPPYGAKDTWAVMARLRAGHARPLRTATNGLRTRGAREGGSPPPFPLTGGDGKPVKAPQASQARPAPHCVGRLLRGRSPRKKPPLTGEVAERQRWPEGLLRFAAAGGTREG